ENEVMLTMRPNFLAIIGSIAFWISSTATIMLATTPSIIFCRSSSRKSRKGGPALLLTRMSGSGQAANSAFCPSAEATSAATGIIVAPVAWRSSAAVAARRSRSRPLITTSQPACASAVAQARPSPRLEAQTMALRPAIPRSMPHLPKYFLPRLRPFHHRRHRGQDRLDIAAGAQAKDRAPVIEQIELDVTSALHELFLALGFGPGLAEISPHQLGIDAEEGAADFLSEGEIGLEVAAIEPIVEDAADAACFAAMFQKKILVAPRLEFIVGGDRGMDIAGGPHRGV